MAGYLASSTFIACLLWFGLDDWLRYPKHPRRDRLAKVGLAVWIVAAAGFAVYVDTHYPR